MLAEEVVEMEVLGEGRMMMDGAVYESGADSGALVVTMAKADTVLVVEVEEAVEIKVMVEVAARCWWWKCERVVVEVRAGEVEVLEAVDVEKEVVVMVVKLVEAEVETVVEEVELAS